MKSKGRDQVQSLSTSSTSKRQLGGVLLAFVTLIVSTEFLASLLRGLNGTKINPNYLK